ncbi:hypothetical protein DL766_003743 [Monosporascus sp. MC13-8B]|uniref:Cwf18 pre-mRNA splicing factor n=1 Tax=Monosporascus cannonballus TaxID=155416 RepID=A0ABY0H245_9PEZI|nr:hypothetical protein DL763_010321 [Monosporascus cannonballus]RYO80352.1 hypothetical protein DL762_007677 [Monosporascus cannonballus]RYP32937.1 hypothetical protein DL766_003743 [Monosporascus sp. MC13-8B]
MSTSHATLSAAADDRKARLAKLKTLKRKQPADEIVAPESERAGSTPAPDDDDAAAAKARAEEEEEGAEVDVARLYLSGRNYDAETKGPKLGFEAPPTLGLEGQTLEAQAADVETEVRRKAAEDAQDDRGVDLFKLQPRKPNWDLKRDLERKLEVLNARTDNAIARLVRERIAGAQQKAANKPVAADGDGEGSGEQAGMDGVALVEGVRLREREEEEDEKREREQADDLAQH